MPRRLRQHPFCFSFGLVLLRRDYSDLQGKICFSRNHQHTAQLAYSFLWYLLEELTAADPDFDGRFTLRRVPEGQRIACTISGQPYSVVMPCPSAADIQVQIVPAVNRLVMQVGR